MSQSAELKRVLCYGDSQSWGIVPGSRNRWPYHQRWTGILQDLLGTQVQVIEECLNGRTTVWEDPFRPNRHGRNFLPVFLESHAPLDLVILFLGTNDLQRVHGVTAYESAAGAAACVGLIQQSAPEPRYKAPRVLLLAPPRIIEPRGVMAEKFADAGEKSVRFSDCFSAVAQEKGVAFFDIATVAGPSATDGVHLDADGHAALGHALAPVVRRLLEN